MTKQSPSLPLEGLFILPVARALSAASSVHAAANAIASESQKPGLLAKKRASFWGDLHGEFLGFQREFKGFQGSILKVLNIVKLILSSWFESVFCRGNLVFLSFLVISPKSTSKETLKTSIA